MPRLLTSDFETTTANKGNVYNPANKAVCVAMKYNDSPTFVVGPEEVLPEPLDVDTYIFFNAKFDVGWWRRLGQDVASWKIHCCQIAEFLLEGQTNPYPSLDDTADKYGLPKKLNVVKTEYWDKGLDTTAVPWPILSEYAAWDVDLTYQVYLKQMEQFKQLPALYKLFKLMCMDLLVLQEMEWNGIKYDVQLCEARSLVIEEQLSKIKDKLSTVYPEMDINFNSGQQLSAFLYGGKIVSTVKEHNGFFKTGAKKGQPKFSNVEKVDQLPRLIEPIRGTELAKEGYYKTDEATLRKLKGPAAKKFVGPLLEMARLEKLNGTYYKGIPKLAIEMNWEPGILHGQLNQVRAATGRLSSSTPNQQNFSNDCKDIFITRFPSPA